MKRKIMVVDDNPYIILFVKKGLDYLAAGYEIIGANGGNACFELLEKGDVPDLILLDIMMPGVNGWQVFAKLKENQAWREIHIIFLTAKTDEYSKGFGKLMADGYVEKPFEIEYLKEMIYKTLSRQTCLP